MLDVLIAGAGPAGSVAAIVLARAGARVLVVDRARFPRPKLCGDTVNPGALALLTHLGLDEIAAGGLRLSGMVVTGPTGARIVGDYGGGLTGRAIARAGFDAALVHAARTAGAQVREGVRVVEPLFDARETPPVVRGAVLDAGDGRRMRVPALVTIAADGRRSALALALGLIRHPPHPRRWAVGAYFENVSGLEARGEMHIRAGHYVGVAPLPDGTANVCYVSASRTGLQSPEELLAHTVRHDELLAARFAHARRTSAVSVIGPLAVDATAAGVPGMLLAGDAAGFIDPMTGDGMRLAMHGGVLAAEVALDMLRDSTLAGHVRLGHRRGEAFGRKLGANRHLRALVAHPALVQAGVLIARVAPGAVRRVIAYAGDAQLARNGWGRTAE